MSSTSWSFGAMSFRGRVWLLLRDWGPSALIFVLIGVLYMPAGVGLVRDWYKDPDYSHGFFVPVFSAYITYRKRRELATAPIRPNRIGILIVLASLGIFFLGSLAAEYFLTRISLLALLAGLVLHFRGLTYLRLLAFPLIFLSMMIPLPILVYEQIILPMQMITSRLVTGVLESLRLFPIMRDGNLLITGRYSVEIVEACSGVRSLMSLLTLSLAYGYLAAARTSTRMILALLVLPLAIIGNALRVCTQVMLAYYFGAHVTEGLWHVLLGLIGFFSAAGLLRAAHGAMKTSTRMFVQKTG